MLYSLSLSLSPYLFLCVVCVSVSVSVCVYVCVCVAQDEHGELARRAQGAEEHEEAETDSDLKGASYIDPAAALEMSRFGLSRKETAALNEALQKEKEEEEKMKQPAHAGVAGGGGGGVPAPGVSR
jgi:hypothetical protein